MLAMPISSSSTSATQDDDPPPNLIFIGPNAQDTVYVEHPNGTLTPIFTLTHHKHEKRNLTISRIPLPSSDPSQQHLQSIQPTLLATATISSLTGSIPLSFPTHNVEFKLKDNLSGREFPSPTGTGNWEWKQNYKANSSGMVWELKDENGMKLAKLKRKEGPRIEVLVQGDERFVDVVVCSALAIVVQKGDSAKKAEGIKTAFDVIGALGGVSS